MNIIKTLPFFLFLFSLSAENILFIGNSYTGGIKSTVTELFKQQGSNAKIEFINPGGKKLKDHINDVKTVNTIRTGDWDKIILQDQSQTPAIPNYNKIFHEATAEFNKLFKSLKKQPKVYYYLTWGRRDGDKKNSKIFPDFETMQDLLTENYKKAAHANGATIVPVGLGFKEVFKKDKEMFESLYARDGSHPSKAGAYLAACIFYGTILNEAPVISIKWNGDLEGYEAVQLRLAAKKIIDSQ